ncbi:MAG TPA: HEAT repeat domain-containing protein [Ktedonobacteraceae bacterium]|nr:HEAT repeat domain-containing protein [Ktedonobacteraceae bacterium]
MSPSPIPFATLLARLANPDPLVRRQSITDLMRRRKERTQAIPSLLALLSDSEESVRKAAIEALGKLHDHRALPALQFLLTDLTQSPHLRVVALRALLLLDPLQTLPHLLLSATLPLMTRVGALPSWNTIFFSRRFSYIFPPKGEIF